MNPETDSQTILIVDDTPRNLALVVRVLEERGYRIAVAQDGEEGLTRARLVRPDLILLDVMLPGIDGFEVCRRLKAEPDTADIPVIFMTALAAIDDKVKGFAAGGVDYVTKPMQIDEVLARVATHLKLRDAQRQLEARNAELTLHRENLERRVAERTAELAAANAALSLKSYALNQVGEAAYLIDAQARFLYVNDEVSRMLGYSHEELRRMTVMDIAPGWSPELWASVWAEMGRTKSFNGEAIHRRKDGRDIPVDIHASQFEFEGRTYNLAMVRDITERKRAEEELRRYRDHLEDLVSERTAALRASEAHLHALIDNLPFEFWAMDRDLRYTMQNAASLRSYGGVVGKRIEDLGLPPVVAESWLEQDRKVLGGEILRSEYQNTKDGETRFFESLVAPVRVESEVVGIVGVAMDISERKQAEQRLRQALEFSEGIINAIPDILFEMDRDGCYLNVWARDPGLLADRKESLVGKTVHEVLSPENAEAAMDAIRRADENGWSQGEDICIEVGHGRRWFAHSLSKKPGGSPDHPTFLALSRDITERKLAELRLKEALEFTEGVIDAIPDLLFEMDRTGRYLNIWTHTPQLLAAQREALLGHTVHEALSAETAATVMDTLREAEAGGLSFGKVIRIDLPTGPAWFELSASRRPGGAPDAPRFLMLSRDVSERVQREDEIRRMNAELEQRVRARTAELEAANAEQLESELRYRQLFENSPVSLWEEDFSAVKEIFDAWRDAGVEDLDAYFDGHPEAVRRCAAAVRIVDVNQAALDLHKAASRADLLARLDATFMPESFRAFRREMVAMWRGETSLKTEAVVMTLTGEPRHVMVHVAVGAGYEASLGRVLVSLIDITERKRMEEALAAREREFRTLAENIPAQIIRYDREARKIYLNTATTCLMGRPAAALLGQTPEETPEEHRAMKIDEFARRVRRVLASGQPEEMEVNLRHAELGPQVHQVRFVAERDEAGEITGALMVGMDITERKRAEEALAAREREFRTLAENLPDNVVRYNRECRATYVSPSLYRSMATSGDQLGRTPLEVGPDIDAVRQYQAELEKVIATGEPASLEVEVPNPAGEMRTHQIRFVAERRGDGEIRGALAIGRDITAIKKTERRLAESHARLRALAAQRETAREEERKRIAQEIHDELGQVLTALKLGISTLRLRYGAGHPDLADSIHQLLALTDRSIQVVRGVAHSLRPAALEMGILPALEWLAGEFQRHAEIPCHLDLPKGKPHLDEIRSMVLFRLVQEGLTNVARHARATRVDIRLECRGGRCRLVIADDGAGFDPAGVGLGSFGLLGMRERVDQLGGHVVIDSAPGRGTRIAVELPLERDQNTAT